MNNLKFIWLRLAAALPPGTQRAHPSGNRLAAYAGSISLWLLASTAAASDNDHAARLAVEKYLNVALMTHAAEHHWQGARVTFQNPPGLDGQPRCTGVLNVTSLDPTASMFSRQRLNVACPGQGWAHTISVQPRVFAQAIVARRTIERGERLSASNVGMQEVPIKRPEVNILTDLSELNEHVAKRRIRAGQVLTAELLGEPWLIRRGQRVVIVGEANGIRASALGEALEPGRQGDRLRVRNLTSKKIIVVRAIESGTVCSTCEK